MTGGVFFWLSEQEGGGAPVTYMLKNRDAADHPTMHSTTKNYPAPSSNGADAEKPCKKLLQISEFILWWLIAHSHSLGQTQEA